MSKRTLDFSKTRIMALKPKEKRYAVYDEGGRESVKGLRIWITTTGSKSFQLYKWQSGKVITVTLGKFPQMSVQQARKLSTQQTAEMLGGANPNEEKKKRRIQGITLSEAYADYLDERDLAENTRNGYERAFKNYLTPLHDRALSGITRPEILSLHKQGSKRSQSSTNTAFRLLRAIYNYAMDAYIDQNGVPLIKHNPTVELKVKNVWRKSKEQPRTNTLSPDDLKRWFTATEDLTEVMRHYLRLVLLTGLRRREASTLTWKQIDFKNKTILISDTKNSRPLVLPMTRYIEQLLMDRKSANKGKWIFPSELSKSGHVEEPKKATATIFARTGIKATIHDLRRTFGSIAGSGVVPISHVALKKLMNHSVSNDVTANHYVSLNVEQLRKPLQELEDFILRTARVIESAEIVPFPTASNTGQTQI